MWAVIGFGVRYEELHNTMCGQSFGISTPSPYLAYVPAVKIRFQILIAFSVFHVVSLGDYLLAFQSLVFPLSIGPSNPRRK